MIFADGVRAVAVRRVNSADGSSVAISNVIEQSLPPAGTVFLEHIGLVGYRCGCYIYDSMGLVTPETTGSGKSTVQRGFRRLTANITRTL